ncbi:hypothetical protein HDC94_002273 [Leifsonia sp. AK011]|uniref:hypothetical protein n=1 Tax=Leifsonia sp. AK011 TaxID=2723075 RepID=UPI0015CE4C1B|nr:hypothetical protein [Leifsonia sp. AK011]NYF11117.1 hypothetical protein [Leifsonia sp. AK011]
MSWTPLDTTVVILAAVLAVLGASMTFSAPWASGGRVWVKGVGALIAVMAVIAILLVVINAMIPPIT